MTKFLNTRILLSGATILAAAVVIVGATLAFFSDVETSEANAFTAGDVQIGIGNLGHEYTGLGGLEGDEPNFTWDANGFSFDLVDIKPLDSGDVTYTLTNDANDAMVCAMVEADNNTENARNDSEIEAGDTTGGNPGLGNGELQNFMSFAFGGDSGMLSAIDGEWFEVGAIAGNGGSGDFAIGYCFGEYDDSENCIANSTGDVNTAQTDGMTADISFQAVQTRNNPGFNCASLNESEPFVIGAADLAQDLDDLAEDPASWFFYNDQTGSIDGVEGINNSIGSFVVGPATPPLGTGSIQISTPVETPASNNVRRNIATYQFNDVKLSDIDAMSFATLSQSASNGAGPNAAPYLHFNVDFANDDSWQRRLVYVPSVNGAITPDAWQTWNTTGSALWTWSGFAGNGNQWPDGNTNPNRTWDDIVAAFPNAETRSTDSWLGIRVGEPYPGGFTGNIDNFSITVNGVEKTFDFDN